VECEKKSGVVSDGSGVISEESGVINVEWSGFGGEWSAKCRVEWFRRGSINVEWSVIGEVGSCTAPYNCPFAISPAFGGTMSKDSVQTIDQTLN
jgi:hypothetical protein